MVDIDFWWVQKMAKNATKFKMAVHVNIWVVCKRKIEYIYILYININKKIPISMIFNIFFRVVKILLGNRYLLKNY